MSKKVEEASMVDNSHFCLMFYPVQLTNKYLVTLPLMEPDAEVLITFIYSTTAWVSGMDDAVFSV